MSAEPRYQLALRGRTTGEVHVSEASCLLTAELTRMPNGSEHQVVSVRGLVGADDTIVMRLLANLIRWLAGLLRVAPVEPRDRGVSRRHPHERARPRDQRLGPRVP